MVLWLFSELWLRCFHIFFHFAFIKIGQCKVDRKRSGGERDWGGGGVAKGPQAAIRSRDAHNATALYVGALPLGYRHQLVTLTWGLWLV